MGLRSAIRRLEAAVGTEKPCPGCGYRPGDSVKPEIVVVGGFASLLELEEGDTEGDTQSDTQGDTPEAEFCPECGRQTKMVVELVWKKNWRES